MDLTLIGTSHLDLQGYDRLVKLLNYLGPSVVGVEDTEEEFRNLVKVVKLFSNPKVVDEAVKKARERLKKANLETLRLFFSNLDFDTKAVKMYSDMVDISIVFCESPVEMKKYMSSLQKPKNLKELTDIFVEFISLTPEEAREDVEKDYTKQVYSVKDLPQLVQFYSKRDEFAELVLRQQKGKVVYVCGLDHIFGDYSPNLYDRLKDLKPRRMKLSEADGLNQ